MPELNWADPLPHRPERVVLVGASGSGKSTLAPIVVGVLGSPCVEFDALAHGPGWIRRPELAADVEAFSTGPRWVCDSMYSDFVAVLAPRADTLVWLDLPRHRVMRQVTRRTLARRWHRTELWNGNTEPPLRTILTDREHIIRWAWDTQPATADKVAAAVAVNPSLTVVRLRSHVEARRWCAGPLAG